MEFALIPAMFSRNVLWLVSELFFKELTKVNQTSLILLYTCYSKLNETFWSTLFLIVFPLFFSKAFPTVAAKILSIKCFMPSVCTVKLFLCRTVQSPSKCFNLALLKQLHFLTFKYLVVRAADNAENCHLKSYWTHWLPSEALQWLQTLQCRLNPWKVWNMCKNGETDAKDFLLFGITKIKMFLSLMVYLNTTSWFIMALPNCFPDKEKSYICG